MTNLNEEELAGIERRAELCFEFGDTAALRADDVALLIAEVREMWALKKHLIALNRQGLEQLATEADADAEEPIP